MTSLAERFADKTEPEPNSGCLLWTGGADKDGYGMLSVAGRNRRATHVALELQGVAIIRGQQVLHRCDTPACVNPEHLFTGTNQDNVDDMLRKGRQRNQVKTRCRAGHPFDDVNTYHMPGGMRGCKTCRRAQLRAYYARLRAAGIKRRANGWAK